jgi:hypothetical protein
MNREGNNDTERDMEKGGKLKLESCWEGTDPTGSGGAGTFQCVDYELSVGQF